MAQQQQYSYGYGYPPGYGFGAAASNVPNWQTRPPLSQPAVQVPAVGYSPYQAPAAKQPPPPAMPVATRTSTSSYYQQPLANQQQQAALAASYYGYSAPAAAPSYPSYYPSQPPTSTAPRPPPLPTVSYQAPVYTPSSIKPPTQSMPSATKPSFTSTAVSTYPLVSYPSSTPYVPAVTTIAPPPAKPLISTPLSQGTQNINTPPGYQNFNNAQSPQNLTPQQRQVVAQYAQKKTGVQNKMPWWSKRASAGTGQEHYCEVCKISAASAQTYQTHLEGKLHKKKVAQQKHIKTEDKKSCEYYCELCDVVCSNGDSLEAHSKGSKHQKVLNLHRRLGKPIPAMKLVDNGAGKKVLAGPKITFIGGKTLHSTNQEVNKPGEMKVYPPASSVPIQPPKQKSTFTQNKGNKDKDNGNKEQEQEKEVESVGEHLIKECKGDPKFPHAQYKCEMCDCYFNDDYAKKAHIKGRRHRLNFKKTYQPDLYVEPTNMQRKEMEKKRKHREAQAANKRGGGHSYGGQGYGQFSDGDGGVVGEEVIEDEWDGGWDPSMNPDHSHDPHDDILVMDKHKLIYPSLAESKAVGKVVEDVEKALKNISDDLMKEKAASVMGDSQDESFRDLKGVMRIGAFAHRLLLKGECSVELVLMCAKKPTMALFNLVINRLALRFESLLRDSESENIYNTTPLPDKATVTIISQVGAYRVIVSVTFSSTLMRQEPSALQLQADQSEGVLNRQCCLAALAALRHTKWFKAMSQDTPTSVIVLRVFKDICRRVPAWGVLDSWMVELLVQKCALTSHPAYGQPGDLFRRVMECVASGVFLPGGRGLLDPCEKDPVDACAPLSAADRSNITLSAQHALRLIAFRKLHLVLGVEPLPGDVVEPGAPPGGSETKEEEVVTGLKRGAPGDLSDGGPTKKMNFGQS